jgi:hypothetical protein
MGPSLTKNKMAPSIFWYLLVVVQIFTKMSKRHPFSGIWVVEMKVFNIFGHLLKSYDTNNSVIQSHYDSILSR